MRLLAAATVGMAMAIAAVAIVPSADASRKAGPCGDPSVSPRQLTMHAMRTSVLCLVDLARVDYGLRPLRFNGDLRASATNHSRSMVTHDYFAHEGPGGSIDHRLARAGYLGRVGSYSIGENIGGGVGRRFGSPLAVYRAWMKSPSHRANILDPRFHDFGVGVSRGFPTGAGVAAATYTIDFGARH